MSNELKFNSTTLHLLNLIGFRLTLVPGNLHEAITGVQVTVEHNNLPTVDLRISPETGPRENVRFVLGIDNEWKVVPPSAADVDIEQPKQVYTTMDVARLCRVGVKTALGWCSSGMIATWKTPGGHYRIERSSLIAFMVTHGIPLGQLKELADEQPQEDTSKTQETTHQGDTQAPN